VDANRRHPSRQDEAFAFQRIAISRWRAGFANGGEEVSLLRRG
jgi:hypothetical protein